ncbi:MAG: TetR family transcriptional regulator [Kofleriaceae bacterium]
MSRWEPDARGRLVKAALELFRERGYDAVTVAEIAEHAGLTERTFFRYFADKREALFFGEDKFQALLVEQVSTAPLPPLTAIKTALHALGAMWESIPDHATFARVRAELIAANAELRERELHKMASVSAAIAAALKKRGIKEPAATLAAETGIAVLRVAFARFVADGKRRKFAVHVDEAFSALASLSH